MAQELNVHRIPPLQALPTAVSPYMGPWRVFQLSLRTGDLDGDEFPYYIEDGDPIEMPIEQLPSEIYAHDLQKVDATDPVKVMSFCQRYGLIASPTYLGEQRLVEFRTRSAHGYASRAVRDLIAPSQPCMSELNPPIMRREDLSQELLNDSPVRLSERAREIEIDSPTVAGAISFAEVSQAIRALQTATVLPIAVSHATSSSWTVEELLGYLGNKRYLSQAGPAYFLCSNDPLFRGTLLEPYAKRYAGEEGFRMMADRATETGLDPETIYMDALARELYLRSSEALAFLGEAQRVYSLPPTEADRRASRLGTRSNPFERISERLRRNTETEWTPWTPAGSLGSAIIHQFTKTYSDPLPYRTCKNCGRIFKKYREEGYAKNIRETIFCRKSCTSSYNQKKARRSQSTEGC